MRQKPKNCESCACFSHGNDFSAVEGTGANGVLFVGEASGEFEARVGTPFVPYAPAGSVLERILRRMGLNREQFSLTNAQRCRPKQNWLADAPWEVSALRHCRPNLEAAIAERQPRVIVSLGGIATRELTGMAGEAQGVSHLAGYVLPYQYSRPIRCSECISFEHNKPSASCVVCGGTGYIGGTEPRRDAIPVVPNFHPSYLRRGAASHQGLFARHLLRAINISTGKDRNWLWGTPEELLAKMPGYHVRPTLNEATSYYNFLKDSPQLPIIYDIETNESTSLDEDAREGFLDTYVTQIQFCAEPGIAWCFPWEPPYIAIAHAILQLPNVKAGHNVWLFDNKVLRAEGLRQGINLVPAGIVHDTLQMFHHWQPDLPAHLQFCSSFIHFPFPWKHFSGDTHLLPFYGCCDVDSNRRLFTFLEGALKRDQIWDDSAAAA